MYKQTKKNTIRVYKNRAQYDFQTIHSILASTFVATVSFVVYDDGDDEPRPFSLPMTAVAGRYNPNSQKLPEDDGDDETYVQNHEAYNQPLDIYLHGNAAMILNKLATSQGSVRICITATKVDGVVLHFAPNGHSLNYRSCVIHGDATKVTDPDEKYHAMHLLTNHMCRRRWSSVNPIAPRAMSSVQVLKVSIRSASAKARATNINGLEREGFGERDDVYTGVVPMYEVLGEPVHSGYHPDRPVQPEMQQWIDTRNRRERDYAEKVAQIPSS